VDDSSRRGRPTRVELEVVAEYRLDISQPYDPFKGLPLTQPTQRVAVQTCPLCQGAGWIGEEAAA
jgi:hypothetical protein